MTAAANTGKVGEHLPWTILIVGKSGHVINSLRDTVVTFDGAEDEEFWRGIVTACNAHDDLVKALEKISQQMTMGELIAEYGEDYLGDPEAGYDAIIMIARTALSQLPTHRTASEGE